ncbi:MAG: hypothetical protein ABJO72_02720 [Hyphomicrobiales bacterium]
MTQDRKEHLTTVLAAYTNKVTQSPQKAREALTDEGIYSTDGKLMPEYGEATPR